MDQGTVDAIWEDLQGTLGDSLRGVTMYEGIDQTSRLREDIRERYSEEISRKLADESVVDQFSEVRLSKAIEAGPLEVVVRFYPEFFLIAWSPEDEHEKGVLVAYDRPTDREGKLRLFEVAEYLDALDTELFD